MQRNFKGIWIPKRLWLSKDLTVMEKLFFVEIDSLDNEQGCFASNAHFAEFFHISKGRCSQIIKSLEAKKLVSVTIEREGKVITRRVIRILNIVVRKLNNPSDKTKYPYLENDEGSNTLKNNTKREKSALDFLKNNHPLKYDQFEMSYKNQITDFKKFCLDFNDTIIEEKKEFDSALFGRLGKYARNWIENQSKYKIGNDVAPTGAPKGFLPNHKF